MGDLQAQGRRSLRNLLKKLPVENRADVSDWAETFERTAENGGLQNG